MYEELGKVHDILRTRVQYRTQYRSDECSRRRTCDVEYGTQCLNLFAVTFEWSELHVLSNPQKLISSS
jgi:hypothetical protein